MKQALSYQDLQAYMEGWSDRIEDSRFIANCVDGTPYRGWIEFQSNELAKSFMSMIKQNHEVEMVETSATIVAFNYVDESTPK